MASSRSAIWMTFAAAASTLVIVVAVIAGPSIIQCSSSPQGLLDCLRGEVVDIGLLPEEPTPPVPAAPEPEPPPAEAPVAPAAPPVAPAAPPDVNLVRAEPDGHVIVAGTAAPGVEVEVFANGDLVGKVMAEASGDWVLVPDRPLAIGSATISAGISGSNEQSPHTFTVVIPADKASQPVITATGPAVPAAAETPQPQPAAAPEPEPEIASEPHPIAEAKPEPPAAEPEPPAAESEPTTEPEPTPTPQIALAPDVPQRAPAEPASDPNLEPEPPPIVAAAPEPVGPPQQLAEAEPAEMPASEAAATPVPTQPPTIDAIEIEGSANYFAGAGPEGATVRLYVQDQFIAAARIEGGRWLVEAQGALNLPVQRVRIDLVEPQRNEVSARAEVNFVVDVPPPLPPVEATATAAGSAAPAAAASGELAVAPQVESELEVDPAIPTLRALPSVDPKMLRFASGKAIIRRGETLWAIAERVYGDGRQYRRIVEANEGLIRSPGRIFPGQVFDLPKLQEQGAAN